VWRNLIGKHQPGGAQIMTEPSLYERLGGAFAGAPTLRRAALAVVIAGALLLAGSPAQAQAAWTVVPSPNEPGSNYLYSVDATDASHVWAVGREFPINATSYHSLLLRYDGTAWRTAPQSGFPVNNQLYGVDAVAANDAWAVGSYHVDFARSRTLVAHWDGTTWTAVPTPNANPDSLNDLSAVAAVPNSPGSVWSVGISGESASSANRRALILQRAGGAWRLVAAPRVTASDYLTAVDATGANDAWAVGYGSDGLSAGPTTPIVLRWTGTAWRQLRLPTSAATELYGVEALAPNDVWVVGRTAPDGYTWGPFAAHFDGISWRLVAVPAVAYDNNTRLNDVVALSPADIYAVGATGQGTTLVVHWNGASWTTEPTVSSGILAGAAVLGPRTVWAVGYRFDLNAYALRKLTFRTS
jgi:hypothetical protein